MPRLSLYAAFDCRPDSGQAFACVPAAAPDVDAALGPAETRLLAALFAADGATIAALGRRTAVRRPAVEAALTGLARQGLVEQVASRAWLTGKGFATRRAGEMAGA